VTTFEYIHEFNLSVITNSINRGKKANTWFCIWPETGQASITVPIIPAMAWTRLCFSALSGRAIARCRADFISTVRTVWASGLWLHAATLAMSRRHSAGVSLSPTSWHDGRRRSSRNDNTLHSCSHPITTTTFQWNTRSILKVDCTMHGIRWTTRLTRGNYLG